MRREKSAERASKALFIVANGDIAGGRCGAIARCSAKRPTIGPANMSTQSIGRHTKKNVPPGRVSAARGRSSSITLELLDGPWTGGDGKIEKAGERS